MALTVKTLQGLAMLAISILLVPSAYALPIAASGHGIFTNPTGPATMVTTGDGTNFFTWGDGPTPSTLHLNVFSGVTQTGVFFDLAEVTYFNGTFTDGTQADAIDMEVSLDFSTPTGITETLVFNMGLINTPDSSDPTASADILMFPDFLPIATFISNGFEYTFSAGAQVRDDEAGFTSERLFPIEEGVTETGTLKALITVQAVPEPATVILLGLGLLGIGVTRRTR